MKAARAPRKEKADVRLLVVKDGRLEDSSIESLPEQLRPGDLLVVNDAATLPASLVARDARNHPVEIRLTTQLQDNAWQAVAFGEGDWRTPTEHRAAPPPFRKGDEIRLAPDFTARVAGEDPRGARLLTLVFNQSGAALWQKLYAHGKPVQYSYMNDELKLWSVQNIYGSRPWAVEMPSAGHALNWNLLLRLLRRGIEVVPITHGAGLSSTGDAALDQSLPLAERYEIPAATMEAVRRARSRGGRVIAIGTSVVRALESAGQGLSGFTTLKLGPGSVRTVVDGLLTGTHDVSESHYQLLQAFLPPDTLAAVSRRLEATGYLTHEFGDLCLLI